MIYLLLSHSECKEPTELVFDSCAGKQNCTLYFRETQIPRCGQNAFADLLDFEYQCIPAIPINNAKIYTCEETAVSVQNGFIQSPNYPKQLFDVDCLIKVTPPANYAIRFYFIDLSLKSRNEIK